MTLRVRVNPDPLNSDLDDEDSEDDNENDHPEETSGNGVNMVIYTALYLFLATELDGNVLGYDNNGHMVLSLFLQLF